MTHSINNLQSQLWKTILCVFSIVVVGYGIFRIIPIVRGVQIITTNTTESQIENNSLMLNGQALHARSLSINGRPILIDPSGEFNDEIILTSGINKIMLSAVDVRGKTHTKELVMVGQPAIPSEPRPVVAVDIPTNQETINN